MKVPTKAAAIGHLQDAYFLLDAVVVKSLAETHALIELSEVLAHINSIAATEGTDVQISSSDIEDELCYCGHLKSQHGNRYEQGHGNCLKCDCPQFTWKEFIFKKEVRNAGS